MRRRRWAPLAAACLVALVVLTAAVRGPTGAPGAGAPMPAPRRSGAARGAAFDAAAIARCKKQGKSAGPACGRLPVGVGGGGGDDDKRVVPTGSNPLHNR